MFAAISLLNVSAQAVIPDSMRSVMNDRNFEDSKISVSVFDVTDNKFILEHLAETPRNPASVAKLISTAVGLDLYGPEHQFITEFRSHGVPVDGVLNDHLIIKGYGDADIDYEDLTEMVEALDALGISQINGDLLIDNTYFDQRGENTDPLDENIYSGYNAVPTATMINEQGLPVEITIEAGKPVVSTRPEMSGIAIQNDLKAITSGCNRSRYSYEPILDVESEAPVSIRLWGTFSTHCRTTVLDRLGIPPVWLFGQSFLAAWEAAGKQLLGQILKVAVSDYSLRAPILYQHLSNPLSELIADINKYSNNPKARSLFLSVGASLDEPPSSQRDSRAVIKQWFETKLHALVDAQFIDNGSGLSRVTSITANNLTRMLAYVAKQPYFETYRDSLPIMGVDGTLRRRMRGTPLDGNAWMKTGSIRGVKALAGYMMSSQGHLLAVSILHEDIQVSVVSANPAHEALLTWLERNF